MNNNYLQLLEHQQKICFGFLVKAYEQQKQYSSNIVSFHAKQWYLINERYQRLQSECVEHNTFYYYYIDQLEDNPKLDFIECLKWYIRDAIVDDNFIEHFVNHLAELLAVKDFIYNYLKSPK